MTTKLNLLMFALALAALIVLLFILPPDSDASRYENRAMATPPVFRAEDILSGKFSNDLEAYFSDSIAFRTAFLGLSSTMQNAYGIRMGGPTLVDIDFADLGAGLVVNPGKGSTDGNSETDKDEQDVRNDDDLQGEQGAQDGQGEKGGLGGQDGSGGTGGSGGQDAAGGQGGLGGQGGSGGQDAAGGQGESGGQETAGGQGESGGQETAGGQDSPGTPDVNTPFTLPPSSGRRIRPGDSFGVDIHYNPNVIFYGKFYTAGETVTQYVNTLNSFREGLPGNVRVFCLLAPSLVEFLDERYSGGDGIQNRAINNIYRRLSDGIIPVDAYKWIAERVDSEYLYLRTDHHWTTLGAYYAYLAYAEAAGLTPVTIYNYVEFAFPGYIGSMVTGTPEKIVLDNPDTLYYYQIEGTVFSQSLIVIPENMEDMGYRVFMDGDHDILDYTSSNKNGKMLIVIKDSFANALIPWISPNYERIVVLDPRLYTGSVRNLVNDSMEIDILFVNTSLTPSLPGFVEKIGNIW